MSIFKLDYPHRNQYGYQIKVGSKRNKFLTLMVSQKGNRIKRRANKKEELHVFKKAQEIESEYRKLQISEADSRRIQRYTNPDRRSRKPGMTRVSGITLVNRRTNRGDRSYFYPGFVVNVIEAKPKCFYIRVHGWTGAWRKAVEHLAHLKKINHYDHLLRRIPRKTQLDLVVERSHL